MKTFTATPDDISHDWHVVDAAGVPLGRLASAVAQLIRGKHKPTYTPHMDGGDFVVILNASKVKLTGKKLDQKKYFSHSGYMGHESFTPVKNLLESPARLEDVDPAGYDAVFIPGGHGPMQDLAVNPDVARILAVMLPDDSKVVASLCHGPAAFLAAGDAEGNWLFKGRKLTAFTDDEEKQAGLANNAPWLLEDRLRAAGAVFEPGPAWASHVVVDGNLITAQNPASAEAAGKAILAKL